MINEIMATASVDVVHIGIYREGERYLRSKYGINYPYLFPDRKEIPGQDPDNHNFQFPGIGRRPVPVVVGWSNLLPERTISRRSRERTPLKFGALFERQGQNDFDQINVSGVPGGTNNQNGRFIFDNTRAGAETTGLAIANAAMGLFTSYAEIGPRANTPYRSNMLEWYGQDSWKVTPQLTLEYGVRWTYVTPYYYSNWGNIAIFDPKKYDPAKAVVQDPKTGYILSGDRFNGVVIPGNGWPEAAKGRVAIADSGEYDRLLSGGSNLPAKRHWDNFQPRLGFAYQFAEKNVIRGGAGKFMARPGVSDNVFLGGNPPFQPMMSIANGQADSPAGGKPSLLPAVLHDDGSRNSRFRTPTCGTSFMSGRLPMETTVSVGYVGRAGNNLERERNLNTLPVGTLYMPANKGINTNVVASLQRLRTDSDGRERGSFQVRRVCRSSSIAGSTRGLGSVWRTLTRGLTTTLTIVATEC